jgi:hypothetical protein
MGTCEKCGMRFDGATGFKRHRQRKTPCGGVGALTEPVRCRFCGREYRSREGLARHVQRKCPIATNPRYLARIEELDRSFREWEAARRAARERAEREAKLDYLVEYARRILRAQEAQNAQEAREA